VVFNPQEKEGASSAQPRGESLKYVAEGLSTGDVLGFVESGGIVDLQLVFRRDFIESEFGDSIGQAIGTVAEVFVYITNGRRARRRFGKVTPDVTDVFDLHGDDQVGRTHIGFDQLVTAMVSGLYADGKHAGPSTPAHGLVLDDVSSRRDDRSGNPGGLHEATGHDRSGGVAGAEKDQVGLFRPRGTRVRRPHPIYLRLVV
jgi:hypothetical protein